METKGDLQEALNIFKQIVDNDKADRPLSAKAQLHIAMCKEKLGLKEAIKAIEKELGINVKGSFSTLRERIEKLSRYDSELKVILKTF